MKQKKPLNLDEIIKKSKHDLVQEDAANKTKVDGLNTVFNRHLASAYQGKPITHNRKMNEEETKAAEKILQQQPIDAILRMPEDLERGFEINKTPKSSRSTYRSLLRWWLERMKGYSWYPHNQQSASTLIQDECSPGRVVSGRRSYTEKQLTSRRGFREKYRFDIAQGSAKLQQQYNEYLQHLETLYQKGQLKPEGVEFYIRELLLTLGFLEEKLGIPAQEITMEHIAPILIPQELDELSYRERTERIVQADCYINSWTQQYFTWMRERNNGLSPKTQNNKCSSWKHVAKFLHRPYVRLEKDYDTLPVIQKFSELGSEIYQNVKRWHKQKASVSDTDAKWPDVIDGETALTTVRKLVVERCRLEARFRRKNGAYKEGHVIAENLQVFLKWLFMTDVPARRQNVYRTTRISLSCPVQRPASVPIGGLYFPLPDSTLREHHPDGTIADNYLARIYSYKDQVFPEGRWMLQIYCYKTDDKYGCYEMMLIDRTFEDGSTVYDHFERYLCGVWREGGFKDRHLYSWWDKDLQGKTGHWLTRGWMEFDSPDTYPLMFNGKVVGRWGYLFPLPTTGCLASKSSFAGSFERTSYHLIGKRITPHIIRNFWATWGHQVGLSAQEMESLAFAMGHSVSTLKNIYDRCSPQEKSRPIYKAIERLLFQHLPPPPDDPVEGLQRFQQPLDVAEALRQFSPEDRLKIWRMVNGDET